MMSIITSISAYPARYIVEMDSVRDLRTCQFTVGVAWRVRATSAAPRQGIAGDWPDAGRDAAGVCGHAAATCATARPSLSRNESAVPPVAPGAACARRHAARSGRPVAAGGDLAWQNRGRDPLRAGRSLPAANVDCHWLITTTGSRPALLSYSSPYLLGRRKLLGR
jgi:hypothetical protein